MITTELFILLVFQVTQTALEIDCCCLDNFATLLFILK